MAYEAREHKQMFSLACDLCGVLLLLLLRRLSPDARETLRIVCNTPLASAILDAMLCAKSSNACFLEVSSCAVDTCRHHVWASGTCVSSNAAAGAFQSYLLQLQAFVGELIFQLLQHLDDAFKRPEDAGRREQSMTRESKRKVQARFLRT